MKALKNTLVFIVGMVVGIILFLVAIAGALFAVASAVKVGELDSYLEANTGTDIFDNDNDFLDKTLLDAGTQLFNDLKNLDNLTLNQLRQRYGIKLPTSISGIDISVLFDYPIKQVPDHLGDIVNAMTLADVGEFLNMDFNEYGLPILNDNLGNNVNVALDNLLKSIDGNSLTLGAIDDNFGITLGENALFDSLRHTPMSAIGEVIDGLKVGTLIDIDEDAFIKAGQNAVYVKADAYVKVADGEYGAAAPYAETYVAGADNGKLIYKELRYVRKEKTTDGVTTVEYVADNKSNAADFVPDPENPVEYYRHYVYLPLSETAAILNKPVEDFSEFEKLIKTYRNCFEADAAGNYLPGEIGMRPLSSLFADAALTLSLETLVDNAGTVSVPSEVYYAESDAPASALAAVPYGINPEVLPDADTRLEEGYGGYLRVHMGKGDLPIQLLAGIAVGNLQNATDSLMSMKLKDLITIDENSAEILVKLQDTPINELSSSIDSLVLSDVTKIELSLYARDDAGLYVFVPAAERYVPYSAEEHAGAQRYKAEFAQAADGKYAALSEDGAVRYYLYNADDPRFAGALRYDKIYSPAADGDFVKISDGGYYTLFKPGMTSDRYSKITTAEGLDYLAATQDQVNDPAVEKYYLDGNTPTLYDGGDRGRLYVVGKAASKVLQRLAFVSVEKIAEEFDKLVLGDALDVEVDSYAVAGDTSDADVDYFYFDGELYMPATQAYIAAHPDETYYYVAASGASNSVLKKLALVTLDNAAARVDDVIDTTFLGELIDVVRSAYVPAADGLYVYVREGKYYTHYNPAEHGADAERFDKIAGYTEATAAELAAGAELYVWDAAASAMAPYTEGATGTVYHLGDTASAPVLQRMSRVTVSGINDAFNKLAVGEVLEMNGDVYAYVATGGSDLSPYTPGGEYYYYADGLYLSADVFNPTFWAAHAGADIYAVSEKGSDNAVIKRLAYVKVEELAKKIDLVIDDTYLKDVVKIDGDVYEPVLPDGGGGIVFDPNTTYYILDRGVYKAVDYQYTQDHPGEKFFTLASTGASHTVLKKMANLRIGELGTRLSEIIDDMPITDLIAINEFYEVREFVEGTDSEQTAKWLVEADPYYTTEDADGALKRYAYVYDAAGKYYRTDYLYEPVTDYEKLSGATTFIHYVQVDAANVGAMLASQNLYIQTKDSQFIHNLPLALYYINKGQIESLYYRAAGGEGGDTASVTAYSNTGSGVNAGLYVNILGQYVKYDSSNVVHLGRELYFKYADGYISEPAGQHGMDRYKINWNATQQSEAFTALAAGEAYSGMTFVKLPQRADGLYYYSPLDAAYAAAVNSGNKPVTYARQVCDTVYIEAADGNYVFYNNGYVAYDADTHAGLTRFAAVQAYVAVQAEVMLLAAGATPENPAYDASTTIPGTRKIAIVKEKSAPVLAAFAEQKVTVSGLDTALRTFTLGQLLEVEPDSILDDPEIMQAQLDQIGSVMQNKLNKMTIGELLQWGNIATIDPAVRAILQDVTLNSFFGSISYDTAKGNLTIDVGKLYGVI